MSDEGVEAPGVGGLDGQQETGGADREYRVIDGGGDAAGDGHGDGEAQCEGAAGVGGPAGEQADEEQEAAGDLDDGGDDGEGFGRPIRQEAHDLVRINREMMPVAPTNPRSAVGAPGAEAVEAEEEEAGSDGYSQIYSWQDAHSIFFQRSAFMEVG